MGNFNRVIMQCKGFITYLLTFVGIAGIFPGWKGEEGGTHT